MEGLLILVALGALASLLVGPILTIAVWQRLSRLEERVEAMRRERLREAAQRRPAASAEMPLTGAPGETEPASEESPAVRATILLREGIESQRSPTRPSAPPRTSPDEPLAGPAASTPRSWDDLPAGLEEALAEKWMAWVGALAVIVGAGFFFKYAVEQGWIGPAARVLIGVITGCGCFAGGVRAVRRGYRFLSEGLVGAALGILYFSFFAANKWYEPPVLELSVSFAGMCVATAAAIAFAAWFNAQPAAVLGLIGGFLTPVMLSTGVDSRWVLFSYLLMLDVGVLGVASFRHWPRLNLLAFSCTVLMWLGWFEEHYAASKLTDASVLMTLFFAVFALLGVWHHLVRRTPARPEDFGLILAAPVVYFAGLYHVTDRDYSHLQGLLAAALAAVYAGLALAALRREGVDRQIPFAFGGLAVTFVTLAVPLQWTGHWVTIAWAAESLILFLLGMRFREPKLSTAGLGLLGVVASILVVYALATFGDPEDFSTHWVRRSSADSIQDVRGGAGPSWTDLLNGRSFSFVAAIVATAVMAWESSRHEPRDARLTRPAPEETGDWLIVGAVVATLALLVVETFAMWYRVDGLVPTLLSLVAIEASGLGLALIVWFTLTGPRWLDRLTLAAFAVSGAALLISFAHALAEWPSDWRMLAGSGAVPTRWRLLLINPRGAGFLAALVAAAVAAGLWKRLQAYESKTSLTVDFGAVLGLGCVVTGFLWLTAEAYAWGVMHAWRTKTSLAVTLVWTLYSAAILVTGVVLRSSGLRKLALALFALTTGKVFLFDVWHLETVIRTFAFVALGVALLTVSWLYRRHRERLRDWIEAEEPHSPVESRT